MLSKVIDLSVGDINKAIEVPPDPKLGDLAFPCFILAKKLKKAPKQIAQELAIKLKSPSLTVKAVGPYINFFFDKGKFVSRITKKALKEKNNYGYSKKYRGKRAMVEFPSPNTNKPLHFGHLRNMSIGESMSCILEKVGYTVIRANLNNDRGIHICKSMLAYQKWGRNRTPSKKSDHFVGDFYIMFSKKAKDDVKLETEAREMLRKWESGDKETLALWRKMNKWAFDGFNQTYKRFGIKFDKQYYESKMFKKGKEMVLKGLGTGLFYEDSTGAIMINLSTEGLDNKVLIRSDGTTVYVTQDIYLGQLKVEDFKLDKSIYVVGSEQNYHFSVLFKIFELLRQIGYNFAKENYHLSHGMVYLPEGRMKSREGTVVDADDLIENLESLASAEIKKRHNKVSKKLASRISIGAIKYFLLKYDARKDFTFNPTESISFSGETGPYLQYALVRAKKILEKAKSVVPKPNNSLQTPPEFELAKTLANFPDVVLEAAEQYAPHKLANYAFKLCKLFSTFYEACPVLQAESAKLKTARLALVKAFAQTLKNSLDLLGIEEFEMM